MPAQAGIHLEIVELFQQIWTPAFAGVTTEEPEKMTFSVAC
jgi:hypothetical protein